MIKIQYHFTQDEINQTINRFGKDFFGKVLNDIETYSAKWKLSGFNLIDSYSVNLVFTCHSALFGDCVLKINNPCRETVTEAQALREYNGKRFCRLCDADTDNGIILEEQIKPGTPLRSVTSLDERLSVFASLYNGLHIPPEKAERYPTYLSWVTRITDYMSKRQDNKELYLHMKRAEELCLSVAARYPKRMLLHGDFHHDNILLNADRTYTVIDPKGVVGDPVFDAPRFILNEVDEEITGETRQKIIKVINTFEKSLNIPADILSRCFYIEMAMGTCWCVEDGEKPSLNDVLLAESVMRNFNDNVNP